MDMMLVFFVIIILVGIYMGVQTLQMRKNNRVSNVFFAKEEIGKCKDEAGFAMEIWKRTAIFSLISLVIGLLGIGNKLLFSMKWLDYVIMILFLAAFIFFTSCLQNVKGKFCN